MKLIRYIICETTHIGAERDGFVCDLSPWLSALGFPYINTLDELIARKPDLAVLEQAIDSGFTTPVADVEEYLAPITNPSKIICLALNYHSHIEEVGRGAPQKPYIFLKAPNSLTGHGQPVFTPHGCKSLSFEAELAVIIGKEGRCIARENALDHVFGYTIMNDMSARDIGKTSLPTIEVDWYCTKSFDSSGPLGPCVVTKEEIADPNNLNIRLRVNGEIKQDGNTNLMVYYIPKLIEFVSENNTLMPGDIIATGTLGGAKGTVVSGDVMEIELDGVGVLRNVIV